MNCNFSLSVASVALVIAGAAGLGCSSSDGSPAADPSLSPERGMRAGGGEVNAAEPGRGEVGTGEAGNPATTSTNESAPLGSPEVLMPMEVSAPVAAPAGPAAVARLCTAKMAVQSPIIADFETYDGTVEAAQFTFNFGSSAPNTGVLAGVFAVDDMTGTSTRFAILSGRTGGWAASHQIVQAKAWGGGMGLWFDCVDASAFSGISLWVRGATAPGTFSLTASFLKASPPNAADARGGGTCAGGPELCRNPAVDGIPLGLDWSLVELPWASFTAGLADGAPFMPTGDELLGLTFGLPIAWGPDPSFVDNPNDMADMPVFLPLPSDIIFQVDDVTFMRP